MSPFFRFVRREPMARFRPEDASRASWVLTVMLCAGVPAAIAGEVLDAMAGAGPLDGLNVEAFARRMGLALAEVGATRPRARSSRKVRVTRYARPAIGGAR